jgi:hypothetical protein
MPPKKRGAKAAAGAAEAGASASGPSAGGSASSSSGHSGVRTAESIEIDSKLLAVDLLVAEMRSQLESAMEPCMEEMRKEVAFFLMRLPSRVKGMRMADFLRECGGDVQVLLDKERKAGK